MLITKFDLVRVGYKINLVKVDLISILMLMVHFFWSSNLKLVKIQKVLGLTLQYFIRLIGSLQLVQAMSKITISMVTQVVKPGTKFYFLSMVYYEIQVETIRRKLYFCWTVRRVLPRCAFTTWPSLWRVWSSRLPLVPTTSGWAWFPSVMTYIRHSVSTSTIWRTRYVRQSVSVHLQYFFSVSEFYNVIL